MCHVLTAESEVDMKWWSTLGENTSVSTFNKLKSAAKYTQEDKPQLIL